jgi:hypothetical protein
LGSSEIVTLAADMASDSSSASRSASENNELVRKSGNAAIFSSDSPAWLPPAALMSSQNAQPTSIATRMHTSARSALGSTLSTATNRDRPF